MKVLTMNQFLVFLLLILIFLGIGNGLLTYQVLNNQEETQQLLKHWSNRQNGEEGEDLYLKGAVKNTIVKKSSEIQACYAALLSQNPEQSEGKVVMDWQINEEGEVIEFAVIRDPFEAPSFRACLESTIKSIRFPPPPFGMNKYVEHSFLFKQ